MEEPVTPVLVTTIARRACVVPVHHVVETMRPQSTEGGTCMHRGESVQVIDASALAGARVEPTRIVVLRVGAERIALLVDDVQEVRRVNAGDIGAAIVTAERATELGAAVAGVLAEVRVLRAPR